MSNLSLEQKISSKNELSNTHVTRIMLTGISVKSTRMYGLDALFYIDNLCSQLGLDIKEYGISFVAEIISFEPLKESFQLSTGKEVQRVVYVGNEKGNDNALPSERTVGFKSSNRFIIDSTVVDQYRIIPISVPVDLKPRLVDPCESYYRLNEEDRKEQEIIYKELRSQYKPKTDNRGRLGYGRTRNTKSKISWGCKNKELYSEDRYFTRSKEINNCYYFSIEYNRVLLWSSRKAASRPICLAVIESETGRIRLTSNFPSVPSGDSWQYEMLENMTQWINDVLSRTNTSEMNSHWNKHLIISGTEHKTLGKPEQASTKKKVKFSRR